MNMQTNRRAMIGALALAPVVAVAADAQLTAPLNRHAEWRRQRDIAFAYANERGISDDECIARCPAFEALEDRIFETPVANREEAVSKLEMLAEFYRDGNVLIDHDRPYEIVTDALRLLGRHH